MNTTKHALKPTPKKTSPKPKRSKRAVIRAVHKSRVVQGSGGYRYQQYEDGTIVIRSGPGIASPVRLTSGKAFLSITTEIGKFPSSDKPNIDDSTTSKDNIALGGEWLNWLSQQANKVGEAASDVFTTVGKWATDLWYSNRTPDRDAPIAPGKSRTNLKTGKSGTPLETALQKVGKIKYVDPVHGKGSGKRNFTKTETSSLKSGSKNIKVASCSPFAYWTLAASGIDINTEIEGDEVSIRQYINIEGGALKGGDYAILVKSGDERIRGAATAFKKAKIGIEVEKNEACPGDYVQTYSKGLGGHSTIVHRARCKGAAIFGLPGSPTPIGFVPKNKRPTPAGFKGEPVRFILDENTDPSTIGKFITEKVELLGAHLSGTDSAGKKQDPGLYTKKATNLSNYFRSYVGRLNSSVWANHKPVNPSKYLDDENTTVDNGSKRSWWKLW